MIFGDESYTTPGVNVIGIGMFPRYAPSAPTATQIYAIQGNSWFNTTNWNASSAINCLMFFPAPEASGIGSANLNLTGILTGGLINIISRVITANNVTGISVSPIISLLGFPDATTCNVVCALRVQSPVATTGTWGRLTGIEVLPQSGATVNQGLWMLGDGIGSDIVFGAGTGTNGDARIYYDGTNLIIDPNAIGAGRVYIGVTANDTLRLATLEFGADVSLSRGAANRLDLASGDSLKLNGAGQLDHAVSDALGGGAAATLGTIGGTGPTAAAQSKWIRVKVAGVDHWVAAWL
jgi:hypothetical protein